MKKISIMLLAALAVLFAFTACPAETKLEPATEAEIDNLAAYLAAFGHDRVLNDLNTIVTDADGVTGLELTKQEVSDTSVVFTLKATNYDFDGKAGDANFPRTASGDYTLTLTGTTAEGKFTASSYKFDSANGITLKMASDAAATLKDVDDVTVVLTGVTGDFVVDAAATSATKKGLELTVADGKVTAVSNPENGAEFGVPSAGTIAIGEHAVDLSDLKTAIADLIKANTPADTTK